MCALKLNDFQQWTLFINVDTKHTHNSEINYIPKNTQCSASDVEAEGVQLTKLFMCASIFQESDSLQDCPEEHAHGEDVCLGGVVATSPHLRGHVEV